MKKTMVDILKEQVKLVKGLYIINVKELQSKYKITFRYNNCETIEELQKTCTPDYEIKLCRKTIDGAMSSIYINNNDLQKAKDWLDHKMWSNISKETMYEKIKNANDSIEMAILIRNMCNELYSENFNCDFIKNYLESTGK